jgi:thioredoxin reductase
LAAALILGRMRRRVLLLDADDPAHTVSEGVYGLFGHDGTPPLELRRLGRDQLLPYSSVTVRVDEVDDVEPIAGGFRVSAGGRASDGSAVVLCPGTRYAPPPLDGVAELWGRGVYHCPYCHGWEVRDRPLATYGSRAAGLALLLTSLSDDVVLFTNGDPDLAADDVERLHRAGVAMRDEPVLRLEAEDGHLARIVFADGSSDARAGLFVMPSYERSPLPSRLGCERDESGAVITDGDGRTSVAGVYAAGDVTTEKKSVVLAAAAGSRAAYSINGEFARGALPVVEIKSGAPR